MPRPQPDKITLDDILMTEALSRRPARPPNWRAESEALRSLTRTLIHDPAVMLQRLVDLAVDLCETRNATAGVSLLETHPDGEDGFRWVALAGTLAHHIGGCTPRHFSPCGVCLERQAPVLFSHPERYFTYFQETNTPFVEGLVLPLMAAGQALGTIWMITHNEERQVDAEDVRLMTGLADFTAVALLQNQQQTQQLLTANAQLEAEAMERRLAEERALAIVENLPGGAVFIVDRDLRYQLARGEALAGAGFASADLVGRTIFEVLPPELVASYEAHYRRALAGEPFEIEHQAHDRWYISRGTPLYYGGDTVDAVLVTSYDITERKRVEDERKRREANLAFLADLMNDFAPLATAKDIMEMAGKRITEYLDLSRYMFVEIFPEAGTCTYLLPSHPPGQLEISGSFVLADYHTEAEHRLLCTGHSMIVNDVRDGTRSPEQIAAFEMFDIGPIVNTPYLSNGRWVFDLGVARSQPSVWREDEIELLRELSARVWLRIERARAEAALQESEQRLAAIFAQAAVGLSEISLDGHFERVNAALCHMLGRSHQDLLAATVPEITHPDDAPKSLEALAHLLQTGGSVSLDKRYRRADGTFFWANSILTRLDDEQGQPRRILAVTIDLSERKRAEADRKQAEAARLQLLQEQAARREAEQANRMKDEFLSMVSHELQSPLVAILGWTRLLRANPPTRDQLAHQLAIIERNATLQAKLIQDMLDISRILVNRLSLTLQPVDLADVVENAIATLRPQADEKNIRIELRLPEEGGNAKCKMQNAKLTVLADRDRLQQVFGNILTNATKFTPASGQITVELSTVAADNKTYAEVRIIDTGIGIAADFLPHVFDRFLQAEKSGSAGGLGLGLAIAHHLVALHHGTIHAESPGLGLGATFTVHLPLLEEDRC